jgi:EAL domain-containing protein (putative c-di-GMP-specific phosphodiesterase class I)
MPSLLVPDRQWESGSHYQSQDLLRVPFTMAFQPVVDIHRREVFAYEALARGPNGEPAAAVFDCVNEANQYAFDQMCRSKAILLATQLGLPVRLALNFLPNAIYHPEVCVHATLAVAEKAGFPARRIIFEITEAEPVADVVRLAALIREYRRSGFRTAIDDFGAGFSGLGLLADLQPNYVKLDMGLIRDIDADRVRRVIVKGIMATCQALAIDVVAEGVETIGEMDVLCDLGMRFFQGYLFARPALEALPPVRWPDTLETSHSGSGSTFHG